MCRICYVGTAASLCDWPRLSMRQDSLNEALIQYKNKMQTRKR